MALQIADELIPLREAFKPMMGADRKYEKCIYYRHPDVCNVDTPQEHPNKQAGWIMWAGNNRDRMADQMELGFIPLRKFGICQSQPDWSEEAKGTPDQYGPWGAILCHPEGPAAFPVSQIMTYKWYDPKRVPVPGVTFPQLDGTPIVEFSCPDCNGRSFGLALHLSRHLRTQHDWTVDDLVKFGAAMGLDFHREFVNEVKTTKTYSAGKSAVPTFAGGRVAAAPVVIERIIPTRSEPVLEVGTVHYSDGSSATGTLPLPDHSPEGAPAVKGGWTPERRAEASRKAKARLGK